MRDTVTFKAWCLEQYKYEHNMSGADTLRLFKKYGVLEYLTDFYDTLHSFGMQYIVQEIDEFIDARREPAEHAI